MKPYSPACERNQEPLLSQLESVFPKTGDILEIGSGTGQHGAFFSSQKLGWNWQPTDITENLAGIEQWRKDSGLGNLKKAKRLEICVSDTIGLDKITKQFDGIFSANVLHIVSSKLMGQLFKTAEHCLKSDGVACIYGPFNYGGEFTSESNERFETWLKAKGPECGIRDIEHVVREAQKAGLILLEDREMPANNRLLLFVKQPKPID